MSLEIARENIRRWKQDPVLFVRECFGVEPDAWQAQVLRAFPAQQRVAMQACKGPGKTAVLAWLGWNFLATRPHPKIAATSISGDNLADGLWTEMSHWQNKSPFLKHAFQWTKTRIFAKDHPETWFMAARTWAKGADQSQQANTLAGLHADYLLFLIDEVGAIPDGVMAAAEAGLATGIETKLVMAGNPTHLEGPLYRAATSEKHLWFHVTITADPDDPNRTPRVSVEWAREQIEKWGGPENNYVLVNVFGKFPKSSINSLLGPDEVSDCMKRVAREEQYSFSQKRLGVDVARFGDDRTVLFPRQGLAAFKPVELRGLRTNDIAARVTAAKAKWGSEIEFVDDTGGYGAGVIDSLLQSGSSPMAINFAGKPIDARFANKRAEMWWLMAEWVKRGGCAPNISQLSRELTAPTYTFNTQGKIIIEPKEMIKERLGFSPDMADALALTFALPEMPSTNSVEGMKANRNKLLSEYDPFDPSRQ